MRSTTEGNGKSWVFTCAVLTWISLLIMSREWKYYWLRLILYMALTLCISTVFSGLGNSLSSIIVSTLNS
ncbi:ABC transporter G family member 3 [Linum perenne]